MSECKNDVCPFHTRTDNVELNEMTSELVTYVGEYAVVTDTAPEVKSDAVNLAVMLGLLKPKNRYVTFVAYLGGDEGTLSSADDIPSPEFYRYWVRHNDENNLLDAHQMVVDSLRADLLDVSKGVGDEYFKSCDDAAEELYQQASAKADEEDF